MKNVEQWRPSKYVSRDGRLHPSSERDELAPSSRWIAQLIIDAYSPAWREYARGSLLDLGCGKVPFFEAYREYVSDTTCVDWPGSPHNNIHIDHFCDLAQPLPFADAQFDTLLSSDVVEHLPDPALAFCEMGRILRPEGVLILNTPFLYMLHEVPHDYYRYTRYSLERLTALAGLEVVELREIGGIVDVFADLGAKTLGMVPVVGAPLSILWQSALTIIAKLPAWKRVRAVSAQRFPIGYFMVARKRAAATASSSPMDKQQSARP